MNFDIYAMVEPKTTTDILSLLEEVRQELKTINEYLDSILKGT